VYAPPPERPVRPGDGSVTSRLLLEKFVADCVEKNKMTAAQAVVFKTTMALRPRRRRQLLDALEDELSANDFEIAEDGTYSAFDWDKLFALLEKWLPIFLKLLL
jgi:hypothetical protein